MGITGPCGGCHLCAGEEGASLEQTQQASLGSAILMKKRLYKAILAPVWQELQNQSESVKEPVCRDRPEAILHVGLFKVMRSD